MNYLKPLDTIREEIEKNASIKTSEEKAHMMEELNVIEQIKHLKQYPFISERLKDGRLTIEGWRYDIGKGKVETYDETEQHFIPLASH